MRIALVSPYDWCVEGGVKNHIEHLAESFREWGHQVVIFAPASNAEAVRGQCHVIGKPRSVPSNGSVARIGMGWKSAQVKRVLREGRFDIVHLHEPLMPLLPYHFLRFAEAPTVGTFHAARDGGHRMYRYTRPLTRRWFRKLDGKIAVSPAAARLISRYFAGYFNIIPNGIEYEHWARPHEPLAEFMDGKRNILFVGRPEKRKGLKYLLRAYLAVRQRLPNTRLIVVGAGDFSRYQAVMKGFPDVVFRSNVPYAELPRYHHSAHVFCCPNTGNESQGYVLLEALAAGVPVVASNIEGFAGVITDGDEGLLVRPRDDDALADAIIRVLNDRPLAKRMAGAGQALAAHYSWDRVARRVLSYYERLLYEHRQVEESRLAADLNSEAEAS